MKSVWEINKYPIQVEKDKKHILIHDEQGNKIKISKKDKNSLVLDLVGSFKSSKD